MRWLRGLLVVALLAAPVVVVTVVAWPSHGSAGGDVRDEGSGPDGELVAGDSIGGSLGAGEVARYDALGTGGNLRFDVTGVPGFDGTLTAVDDDGNQLAYNDDTNGLDPQIVVHVDDGETVTIEVRELGQRPGGFTLDVDDTDQGPTGNAGGGGGVVIEGDIAPAPRPLPAPATTVVLED